MATFGPYSAICYGLTLSAVTVYSVRSWYAPTFNDIADGRPPSVKFCCGHRPRTLRGSVCFRMLAYGGPPVFMHRAGKSSSHRFLNFCFGALVLYMISVAATPLYVEAVRDLLVRVPVAEALCD